MLDPQAAKLVQQLQAAATPMPADTATWLSQYRAELARLQEGQDPAPDMDVVATSCTGPGGQIPLRVYRPTPRAHAPSLVFYHGGGFVAGTLDAYDVPLRQIALLSGWQIVAVDYRLAPEHPYPAATEDCWAALRFVASGALGADPDRLAVGGDSAGGLLAAVTAMTARDAGMALRLQVLLYPNTDLRVATAHASRPAFDGIVVRLDELFRSLDLYLQDADRAAASPLLAPDLGGLCPALLITNEYDPLRDEAEAYGERLRDAGIEVASERLPGCIHGVLQRAATIDAGNQVIARIVDALRKACKPGDMHIT